MNLTEIINNAPKIALGYKNYLLLKVGKLDDKIVQEGARRASICSTCPLSKEGECDKNLKGNVVKDFVYEGKALSQGTEVNGCGCNLKAKWLSEGSQCPLGKWEA